MSRMVSLLKAVAASGIVICLSPHAFAICPTYQPASTFVSRIVNCLDNYPVLNYLAVVGSASTINNNGINAICQDKNGLDGAGYPCSDMAGSLGDAQVSIQFDWARTVLGTEVAPLGCPNPEDLSNVGRNFIQVMCNNGAGAIVTTSYDASSLSYNFDLASKYDPTTGDAFLPIPGGSLRGVSLFSGGGGVTVCIDESTPIQVFSDCDPDSLGSVLGVTCPDTTPTVGYGADIYSAPGFRPPDDPRVSAWTRHSTTPGPNGSRCMTAPPPFCSGYEWIGVTAVVDGQDTGAIATAIPICAPIAATDQVRIDSAAFVQGKLAVSFSTRNEALIVGFNVYAGWSTKLNAGLIPAKRTGSNAYIFEIGRGAARSNRTVTVEAVQSDGTLVRTAAVTVK